MASIVRCSPGMEQNQIDQMIEKTKKNFADTMSARKVIASLKEKGYTKDFYLKYDHFLDQDHTSKLFPENFSVDQMIRLENNTDPDDQSIVYAIRGLGSHKDVMGTFVESYGLYHDDMSPAMTEHLKRCRQQQISNDKAFCK